MKTTVPLRAVSGIDTPFTNRIAAICSTWLAVLITTSALLLASLQADAANYTFTKIADTVDVEWLAFNTRPAINNDGVVAFVGTLEDGGVGNSGVFISDGSSRTTIADTATTAFLTFSTSLAVNDNEDVAFIASDGGRTGIYQGNGASLVEISDGSTGIGEVSINNGATVAFVGAGQAVFSGNGGPLTTIASEADGLRLFGTATINDSGNVGFSATTSTSSIDGVFESNPSGIRRVIDNAGPLEALSNVRFGYNNSGTALVGGRVRATGVVGLHASDGSDIRTLVSEDQGVGGYQFPNINDAEQILFGGFLVTTGQWGIFTGPDSAIDAVILEGDELFGRTVQTPLIGRDSLNSNGAVAFLVDFTDGTRAIVRADPARIAVGVSGGSPQECSLEGGANVRFTLNSQLPDGDTIATVKWFFDGDSVGFGEKLDLFVPLGEHMVNADISTTQGNSYTGSTQVEVVDTTKPDITISLTNRKDKPATSKTRNITVNFDAKDGCDPAPVTTATGGVEVLSGETIQVKPNKGKIVVPGDVFSVTVTATDASDNTAVEQVVLPIAP